MCIKKQSLHVQSVAYEDFCMFCMAVLYVSDNCTKNDVFLRLTDAIFYSSTHLYIPVVTYVNRVNSNVVAE